MRPHSTLLRASLWMLMMRLAMPARECECSIDALDYCSSHDQDCIHGHNEHCVSRNSDSSEPWCMEDGHCATLYGIVGTCDSRGPGRTCQCTFPTPNCEPACQQGTCVIGNTCSCNTGWTGAVCNTPYCTPACVSEQGTCERDGTCTCEAGWTGQSCETPCSGKGKGKGKSKSKGGCLHKGKGKGSSGK